MKPSAVRGMNDVLPDIAGTWRYVEEVVREVVESYGYQEIRLPIIERTELFKRSMVFAAATTAPGRICMRA